jgi:hypothetical protein
MRHDHYDALETRDAKSREEELFGRLPDLIALALSAPGWAERLSGVDPNRVTSREALAALPVTRASDLDALRRTYPPLGGLNVTALDRIRRLIVLPGPTLVPEIGDGDSWGAARALFAAGLRPGYVLHNAFSGARICAAGVMLEAGAQALGCAVIAATTENVQHHVEAIAQFHAAGYVGPIDFLSVLFEAAAITGDDISTVRRAMICDAAPKAALRKDLSSRGIAVFECVTMPDVGVIAYETSARDGLLVNENLIVEILRPGTGDPVADGEAGEIVVTAFNPDYPMIRLATGTMSAVLKGRSSCGRTNVRLASVHGA